MGTEKCDNSSNIAFPHNGSFSVDKIKLVREKTMKMSRSQCGKTEDNKKYLESWEKETECRDRKQTFKQMAKIKKIQMYLYPSFTGCGGPLLDACSPPPQRQNPPQHDAVTRPDSTNRRRVSR